MCHDNPEAMRAPSRDVLRTRTAQQIVTALSAGGLMAAIGEALSAAEKQAVASFLAGAGTPATGATPAGAAAPAGDPVTGACPPGATLPDLTTMPMWNGWGGAASNSRFQDAKSAGLTAADVPKLTLKWAYGFANSTGASAQPTVAAGRVFVGNQNATVQSLDLKTGCTYWVFKPDGGVRTAMAVARLPVGGATRTLVMFGDFRATAYALDAETGELVWKTKVDDHAMARVTGSPSYADGRLYVPVSSTEEVPASRPNYPCCTFRGSVVALDAATGKQI